VAALTHSGRPVDFQLVNCQNCGAPVRLDPGQNVMICDYCKSERALPVDEHGVQITGETGFACRRARRRLGRLVSSFGTCCIAAAVWVSR
jgi:hypothetical protein